MQILSHFFADDFSISILIFLFIKYKFGYAEPATYQWHFGYFLKEISFYT